MSKTVAIEGTVQTTVFIHDGKNVVMQFDGTSPIPTEGGQIAPLTASNLSHRYLWGPAVDQILADEQLSPLPPGGDQGEDGSQGAGYDLTTPGQVLWTLTDNKGSVRDLAEYSASSGTTAVVDHIVYSAFGNIASQMDPATGGAARVSTVFGYTGQMYDSDTGLCYYRARWYNPQTGQFLCQDPSGIASGDVNLYRYVGNSPLNYTDPTGLCEVSRTPTYSTTGGYTFNVTSGNGAAYPTPGPESPYTGDSAPNAPGGENENEAGRRIPPAGPAGHDSDQSPSNRNRHEGGDKRRLDDRGGEKGDENRRLPRRRPDGWKGPWPPTTQQKCVVVVVGGGIIAWIIANAWWEVPVVLSPVGL